MMRKFRFSLVFLLLFAGKLFAADAHWLSLTNGSEFENLAIEAIEQQTSLQIHPEHVTSQTLISALQSDGTTPLFISCDMQTYESLLKDAETKSKLEGLYLDLINPRLISIPFHIAGDQNKGRT